MGRQKGDPNRSRSQPSSSSMAASLVEKSQTTSIGFGGYVGSSRIGIDRQDKDNHVGVHGEAALHLRRLSKKDPITRVKALRALGIIFKEQPASELCQLLPNWIFEYKRLVQDDNQQVREAVHSAMSILTTTVGRGMAPHLRSVMGAWWVSQFDPSREVSMVAQQSFQVSFQGAQKRVEALRFCANDILTFMDELLKLSPQTIADKSTPIEEATKRYEVVVSSTLLALAAFLDIILLKKEESSAIRSIDNGDTSMLGEENNGRRKEVETMAANLCLSHKFFQDYAKSKSSQIRSASYQALSAFAQNVTAVFSGQDMETVGVITLGSFSDKDPSCHSAMWDMVLLVSRRYPQVWDAVSVRKFVLPRLWAFLRHATYGSAEISYPCVLPLLCLIPSHIIKPAVGFLKELFLNLWEGHTGCHMAIKDELALIKAIQECFLWTINNATRFAEEEGILPEQIQCLMIENVLVKILWNNYVFAGMPLPDTISSDFSANQKEASGNSFHAPYSDKIKFSGRFITVLRTCISDILAGIAVKGNNLSSLFWNLFQDVCLKTVIFEEKQSLPSSSERLECIYRISIFISHISLSSSYDASQKQWLLMQAVRPLIAKLYPIVKSMEYREAIQLIATIVSIFGPVSFPALQIPPVVKDKSGTGEGKQCAIKDEGRLALDVSLFIKHDLAPWCLDGNDASSVEKIELLLSFFEDKRLQQEWESVLAYATELEVEVDGVLSINIDKVAVLAVLVEKFRIKFLDAAREDDFYGTQSQPYKQWNLSRLDKAALTVASSLSLSDGSSQKLLRHLLGGSKELLPPIVSKQAAGQVLTLLLQRMIHILMDSQSQWARYVASSVLQPDTGLPLVTTEEKNLQIALACAAVQILCSSKFSIQSLDANSDIVAKVVACLFCMYWNYNILLGKESYGEGDVAIRNDSDDENGEGIIDRQFEANSNIQLIADISDEDLSPFINGSQHETEAMNKMILSIQSVLNSRICKNLSSVIRADIGQMLVQCVRHAIFDASMENVLMTSLCASWLVALIDQVCFDMEETQHLLDFLFEPAYSWPVFVAVPHEIDESTKIVQNQLELEIQEPGHTFFAAFVDKFASSLGWNKVVIRSTSPHIQATESNNYGFHPSYRIWLLIELLCIWHWPGGKAVDSVIPYLEYCAGHASGSPEQIILDNVVNSLFSAVLIRNFCLEFSNKFWMGLDEGMEIIEDACVRALLVLLKKLLKKDPPQAMIHTPERLFSMLILDQGLLEEPLFHKNSNILPFMLTIFVPFLRKRCETFKESISDNSSDVKSQFSLEVVVCKWMLLAGSAPPLSTSDNRRSDVEHLVQIAVSCFPLHHAGGSVTIMAASSARATSEERLLLLALLRKQASREAVSGYHAHVAERRVLAQHGYVEGSDWRHSHQRTLAKLMAATVAYCWQDFESEDWAFVINEMRRWLEAAVIEAEEFTELVASVIKDTDAGEGKESRASTIVANIGLQVTRAKNRQTELTWTAVIIFSLVDAVEKLDYTNSSISVAHLRLNNWDRAKRRAVEDIMRIFFACGLAESVVMDSGFEEYAGSTIALSRIGNTHLWENISEIVLSVSGQERTAAAHSVDLWGVGKGAVRALYGLLFSPHSIGELQLAAYCLLATAPLQQSAVTYEEAALQQEQLEEEALNMGIGETSSSELAKLRNELAIVLETAPVDILESSVLSPLRVNYFLAWAIFLSYLHSISVSSATGEKLVQYAQDSNTYLTLLDSLFQLIPLKSQTGLHGRRKKNPGLQRAEIGNVEAAAGRAAASGSVSFAVEGLWPLEESSLSILAAAIYGLILQVLPACVRVWFTGLRDRSTASAVEAFTSNYCSPQLLADEFLQVHLSSIADESLTIKANQSVGEVTVMYKKEEAGMDMVIRLPKCYPLRPVEVDCTRRLGISETRLRKWLLSMASFLRNQNGAVAEAIRIWKRNVDREFEGVEECPICYSILHTANHSLPRLPCKTCRHKFHAACLYKWFSTSHKSTCPLCQTPF